MTANKYQMVTLLVEIPVQDNDDHLSPAQTVTELLTEHSIHNVVISNSAAVYSSSVVHAYAALLSSDPEERDAIIVNLSKGGV